MRYALIAAVVLCVAGVARAETPARPDEVRVGSAIGQRGYVVPTKQVIRPAGESVEWHGRPVDLAVGAGGKTVYVKGGSSVLVIDAAGWKIRQELKFGDNGGGSMAGIAVAPDGKTVWVTLAKSKLLEGKVAADGTLSWGRTIDVPAVDAPRGGRLAVSYPCGVAVSADGKWALVCQSMGNALAEVDLESAKQVSVVPVGNAPWGVVFSADGKRAYVSNWGGRRARPGEKTGDSAGTAIVVDEHGVASSGTVGVVDVERSKMIAEIPVGLHPGAMALSPDGRKLYVANANSDSVSVIDTTADAVVGTINVKPDEKLPWGSLPNGLAISADGRTMFVAVGGNNAVAVVDLAGGGRVKGFVPAGWFPGAVAVSGGQLYVANVKGVGSRDPAAEGKWASHAYWGTVTKVAVPDEGTLDGYTKQVAGDAQVPQALRAWERAQAGVKAVPVPERAGEPSTIEHVVYVIKENRTYDQVLGDMKRGNGDPKLCTFGKDITPNHHALVEQFALLDNFYCNGVLSADGHAWATEGYAVDYLEKSFGAWARSYPYPGNDAMAFAPTGFIWDNALAHGLTFRNFGEFSTTSVTPQGTAVQVRKDYLSGVRKYKLAQTMALEPLRAYSNHASAGWNLRVPDQQRADVFLKELKEWELKGTFPNLTILYLPSDHTFGTSPGQPTPAAMVADNDLALGRVIEGISHSKFWPKTCVFVIEDDPQSGFDHVDGHRSLCLVASPYTRRGAVVSKFYNQTSVLRTMELMLGLPPMNQMDAMAPVMRDVFTGKADTGPYTALPNNVPLDETNPAKAELSGRQLEMAELSELQDFDEPDKAKEDDLNRVIWFAQMGWDSKYPREWAGPHGRGLKKLGLKVDGSVLDNDD